MRCIIYSLIFLATDENFMSLLSEEADFILLPTKQALHNALEIFQNANILIKNSLRKELLCESDVIVDGTQKMESNNQEKVEIYLLMQFWTRITHGLSQPLISTLQDLAENREDGLVEISRLKYMFWDYT